MLYLLWQFDVIRPGSFRRKGQRDPGPWPWWLWIACAFAMIMAQMAFAGLAVGLIGSGGDELALQVAATIGGTAGAVGAGAALIWVLAAHMPGAGERGLGVGIRGRDVMVGLVALGVTYPVIQLVLMGATLVWIALTGEHPSVVAHETLRTIKDHPDNPLAWMLGLAAVLGAPVIEELVFRVFLQTAILRLTRRAWPAVLLTGVIFTMIHLGSGVPLEQARVLAPLFVLGVAMGIAYERTKRVLVPITMHMGFNAINMGLLMLM